MKTALKRILSIVTAAAVFTASAVGMPKMNGGFTAATAAAADEEYTYGDFRCRVLEDGSIEITGLTNDDPFGIETIEVPETIDGKRVTKFSANTMECKQIVYPDGCEFTDSWELELCALIKYHTDNGAAVIDEYKLGSHTSDANIYMPETICGKSVSSVEKFSRSDSQYASDNSIAVFCKDGIALPADIDKISVRYDTDGDGCRITSVTGSNENAALDFIDVNGRKITSISGFNATVSSVAVEEQLADSIRANCAVLSCVKRGWGYEIVRFENVNKDLTIPPRIGSHSFLNLIVPDELKEKIAVPPYTNAIYYQETETEVLISDIVIQDDLFIPAAINKKTVAGFKEGYSPDLSGGYKRAYVPAILFDKIGVPATYTYSYTENSDSISITGYVDGNNWGSGGTTLEDLFNKPIDTIVLQSGLDFGIDENRSKNIVTYQKDEDNTLKIIEIKQGGDEKSTVTIPESIGGIAVSGIEETAIKDGVTSVIVPENISVPSTVNAVKYITNADGSFTVTSVTAADGASGSAEVKFPETIGNSKVETVIANEDVFVKVAETADKITYKENEGNLTLTVVQKGKNNETVKIPENVGGNSVDTVIAEEGTPVDEPENVNKVTYKEDENGSVVVTDVKIGEGKDKTEIPDKIGGKPVDSVLVKDEINDKVDVPNSVGKITYTEDEDGNVTITSVTPAKDANGDDKAVTIPDTIGGSEPKISDEVKEAIKDIPHAHKTEEIPAVSATCTRPGLTSGVRCSLCGEVLTAQTEVPATGHTWNDGEVTAAASCTTDGVKTYTCTVCGTTKTETITANGHKFENGKCTVCGASDPDWKDTSSDTSGDATKIDPSVKVEALPDGTSLNVEKTADSTELDEFLKNHPEWVLVQAYNVDLYQDGTKTDRSASEIALVFSVPNSFCADDREFAVLRVHNGAVEVLNDTDNSDETVAIKTDKFSKYALVYRAVSEDNSDGSENSAAESADNSSEVSSDGSSETHDTSGVNGGANDNPNTGYIISILPVLLLAGGAMIFARKDKK